MSPREARVMHRCWKAACCLFGLLVFAPLTSCGEDTSSPRYSSGSSTAEEPATSLGDGSYSCEASNDTRGNGPYTLSCNKSGNTVTIHFDNGGYVEIDIDSQERDGEGSWDLSGSDSRGDTWTVSINE